MAVTKFENLFGHHSIDTFLQKQPQGREIGEWQGDREFAFRAKTRSPQSFHNLIHVPTVRGVDFADHTMPLTLTAKINLEGAMRLRMEAQHFYANFLRGAPGPLGGGKESNLIDQRCAIKSGGRQGGDIRITTRRGCEAWSINGVTERF